jgi:hypothetical protein
MGIAEDIQSGFKNVKDQQTDAQAAIDETAHGFEMLDDEQFEAAKAGMVKAIQQKRKGGALAGIGFALLRLGLRLAL